MNLKPVMVKAFPLFLLLFLIGVVGLLLRQPVPGVDRAEEFQYHGGNYTLNLVDKPRLDGEYSGSFHLVEDEITIATEGWSLWSFVSTCSHELYHVDRKIAGDGRSEEVEHEEMPSTEFPWNWKVKCVDLASVRISAITEG